MPETTDTTSRPPTLDHLRSSKKPTRRSVWIALDERYADVLEEKRRGLEIAKQQLKVSPTNAKYKAEVKEAEQAHEQAEKDMRENAVEFIFQSIGRKKYEGLLDHHQPTAKQLREVEEMGEDPKKVQWNHETFPPALLAASMVSPSMTEVEVQELFDSDDWNGNELTDLFLAALAANTQRKFVQLGNV